MHRPTSRHPAHPRRPYLAHLEAGFRVRCHLERRHVPGCLRAAAAGVHERPYLARASHAARVSTSRAVISCGWDCCTEAPHTCKMASHTSRPAPVCLPRQVLVMVFAFCKGMISHASLKQIKATLVRFSRDHTKRQSPCLRILKCSSTRQDIPGSRVCCNGPPKPLSASSTNEVTSKSPSTMPITLLSKGKPSERVRERHLKGGTLNHSTVLFRYH